MGWWVGRCQRSLGRLVMMSSFLFLSLPGFPCRRYLDAEIKVPSTKQEVSDRNTIYQIVHVKVLFQNKQNFMSEENWSKNEGE